jgi:hypothetical protein
VIGMVRKTDGKAVLYLALSAFLILLQVGSFMDFGVIFPLIAALSAVSVLIFLIQYFSIGRPECGRLPFFLTAALAALTALEIAVLVMMGYAASPAEAFLQEIALYGFITIAALMPLCVGTMVLHRFKKRALKALGIILVGFAIFAIALFFLSGTFQTIGLNDAAFTTYYADRVLLAGHNPYSDFLNTGLYGAFQNHTINSVTFRTDGTVGGRTIGYPPLYLLLFLPFAAVSPTIQQFSSSLLYQEAIFALALLAVIGYIGGVRGSGRSAMIALLLVIPFLFFSLISFVDMIVIAALLIAFFFPEKWYFGAALGIAASMQQLAWIPVLMLLLYTIMRSKQARAVRDIAVFGITVLAINIYPLALGPAGYIGKLLSQLGSVLPTSLSPFGILIVRYFDIPLPYFRALFYLGLGISVVLFLLLGKKRNFAILSLVPFLFLDFGRIEYYAVFVVLGAVVAILESSKRPTVQAPMIDRRIAYAALCILGLSAVLVVAVGHMHYAHSFGVYVSGQSATQSNSLGYSGLLHIGNFTGPLRVLLYSFSGNLSLTQVSVTNYSITVSGPGGSTTHQVVGTGVPDNRIYISYPRPTALAVSLYNGTGSYAQCAIYNDTFFYICPQARAVLKG